MESRGSKGPLSIQIRNTDGRNKLVHINRLKLGIPIESNTQPIECEMTSPLFHSTLERPRWKNLNEITKTPNEEIHDQSGMLSTLPAETSSFNRSCNDFNFVNIDSSIQGDQTKSSNLSMNLNDNALDPINTSTPIRSTGRPQRSRKLPTKFGDYVLN